MEKPFFYHKKQINYNEEENIFSNNQMGLYDEITNIGLINPNTTYIHNEAGSCVLETCATYSNETEECLNHIEKRCFPTVDGCRFVCNYLLFKNGIVLIGECLEGELVALMMRLIMELVTVFGHQNAYFWKE
jgi:hypothetical protein